MRATSNDARTFATKYGFNEFFYKDKRTHVFYHVEKMMKVDFMPKSSTLRVWKCGFKEPAVMEKYFMFPVKVKLEILVPGSKKNKKVTGNKAEDGITKLERPLCKTNNDKPKNVCFLTFDREEVARKLVKEGECKRVTDQEERGRFGARGMFGGGWGYGDPYAGYRGYDGGYGDPYARYQLRRWIRRSLMPDTPADTEILTPDTPANTEILTLDTEILTPDTEILTPDTEKMARKGSFTCEMLSTPQS